MLTINATGDTTLHTAGKYCEEDILIKVPEANGENLDAEIAAQNVLIAEQDAKIAELAEVLAGKASGGGNTTREKTELTILIPPDFPPICIHYTFNSELKYIEIKEGVIKVDKYTILAIESLAGLNFREVIGGQSTKLTGSSAAMIYCIEDNAIVTFTKS